MRTIPILVFLLLAASAVFAQSSPADSVATNGGDTVAASDTLAADSAEVAPPGPPLPAPEPRVASASTPPPPQPTIHAFGKTGLRVTLPAGWNGPVAAVEDHAESYALYTFSNAADHPLAGTTLRIERVQGLNQLLRERWANGQTSYGYHGTRPVGPAAQPLPGVGLEVEGRGTGGAVVFLQRGLANWAVQIEAPASVWAERRGEVLAVLAGVELP